MISESDRHAPIAIDPSVALPYWRFDQSAPNVFTRDFMGESDAPPTNRGTRCRRLNLIPQKSILQ